VICRTPFPAWPEGFFGVACSVHILVYMKPEQLVSIQQMKNHLILAGETNRPVKITKKDGKIVDVFIRGFADQQTNIVLFSETPASIALKVFEVKDIRMLQIMDDNNTPMVLKAKWFNKVAKF
jgi:hypothetical protein